MTPFEMESGKTADVTVPEPPPADPIRVKISVMTPDALRTRRSVKSPWVSPVSCDSIVLYNLPLVLFTYLEYFFGQGPR